MTENESVLLLSGYNPRAVIAFCRWASRREVRFHLIASGKNDPVLLTKYADNVAIIRESKELRTADIISWVKTIKQRHGYQRLLILPSTEYFNRFMLKNRAVLENEGCILPLVEESLYTRLSDKREFTDLCQSRDINVPDEFGVIPNETPFVAKPLHYFNSQGTPLYPHLVRNAKDYKAFIESERPEDYFYQEFVEGENHYLLANIQKDGSCMLFSQENLIQQSHGKSVILARTSQYHNSVNAQKYINLLKGIGFWGLIMIEVRQTGPEDYVMIEANPRLWGPMQFVVDNQIDLFGTLLRDNGIAVDDHQGNPESAEYYYWSGGITAYSQPLAFHNYSEEEFIRNIHDIRKHDIYLREDTLNIYMQELGIVE